MVSIVSNSYFLKKLKEISGFKMNLGRSLKKSDEEVVIDDQFIANYRYYFRRIINSFGELGAIKLYEDVLLLNYEIVIFKDEAVYEFNYSQDDLSSIRQYLSLCFKQIDENEKEKTGDIVLQEIQSTNKWVSNDAKNVGKSYEVNQKLSKDDYIQELMKKKKQNTD